MQRRAEETNVLDGEDRMTERAWSRELSGSEIAQLYRRPIDVQQWKRSEASGSLTVDTPTRRGTWEHAHRSRLTPVLLDK